MNKIFAVISSRKFLSAALGAFLALAAFGMPSGLAHADAPTSPPSFFGCVATGGNLGTCFVYAGTWFVATVMGLFISLGGVFINLGLAFNQNVYNSPFIQTGFGIVLSLANLGFVLALIVIAIATILRRDTYGAKATLWRLVVMAILVNFGLVITAPIVNLANNMTTYFTTAVSGSAGIENFTSHMAEAFKPQTLTQAPAVFSVCNSTLNDASHGPGIGAFLIPQSAITAVCNKITSDNKQSPADSFTLALMSLVFQFIFSFLIALAMLCIGVLLLVRYAYLGILLVLLPLAWLMFVFPKFSHEFGKWWSYFIKWTFFPPAAMFFIYLAVLLGTQTPAQAGGSTYLAAVGQSVGGQSGNIPEGAIMQQTGLQYANKDGSPGPIAAAETDIIIIGLMYGGLIAASSMTGKAGAFVVEQAKGVSGAVQGYAAKQSKKAGRATFRALGGEYAVRQMRTGQFGARLKSIPPLHWAVTRAGSNLGQAMAPHLDNRALVEEEKKNLPDDVKQLKENLAGNMRMERVLATIAKLAEKGELTDDLMVNGKNIKDFKDENDRVIKENYGSGKISGDADKALGSDKAMRDAAKALNRVAAANGDTTEALAHYTQASKEFIQKLSKADVSKMNVDGMIKPVKDANGSITGATMASRELLSVIAQHNPQLLTPMLTKAKGATGEAIRLGLDQIYRDEERGMGSWQSDEKLVARMDEINARTQELNGRLAAIANDGKMNAAQKGEARDKIQNELKDLSTEGKPDEMQKRYVEARLNQKYSKDKTDKAIANNVFGQAPFEQGATPSPPPH